MLKRLTVGQKIFSAFLLVFIIFGAVGLESLTALRASSQGFSDYRKFAIESNIISRIQADILESQTNVKDYIITGNEQYHTQYRSNMDKLISILNDADKNISSAERLALINDIKLKIHKYEAKFMDLTNIQKEFTEMNSIVVEQGVLMSKKLDGLINNNSISFDRAILSLASKAINSLYTARLNASKYYRYNKDTNRDLVYKNMSKLEHVLDLMREKTKGKNITELDQIADAQNEYQKAFGKTAKLISKRNKDIKADLSSIGPDLIKSISLAKVSIDKDQQSLGPKLKEKNSQAIINVCITATIAFILGLISIMIIGRDITRPLRSMVNVLDKISLGDLSVKVGHEDRADELGALARSFDSTITSLKKMASDLERIADSDLTIEIILRSAEDSVGKAMTKMVENLKSDNIQIHEAIQTLSSSISQISAATTELTASSAETASAVAETNATVEEVKQTAHLSNEKSRQVADIARNAVQTSQDGQKAAEAAASGMRDIRNQMDTIAQSIVQLSEQSQHIGDIIYVVNDLADQSNILAVNASIEASKAGEEGKGFTVVAREIRNLADQSKQSVAQIQSILADIQKATSTAVMITEEGGKAVESGAKKSNIAGESILNLSSVVTQSAQSSTQIAASSQEQLAGLDQVAVALNSIKQAGEQNLESSRQLEDAIRGLDNQAKMLNVMMERFKL